MIKSIQPYRTDGLQPSPELLEIQPLMEIDRGDFERLREDIKRSGEIRDPIKVYYDKTGSPLILGGFNRWKIAVEIGFEFVPIEIYDGLTPRQRRELVINDNLSRRQLTRTQKENLINYFLKKDPGKSNRAIAKQTKTDHKTVKTARDRLESRGEIPHLKKRTGLDGKKYTPSPRKAEPRPAKKAHHEIVNQLYRSLDAAGPLETVQLIFILKNTADEILGRLDKEHRRRAISVLKALFKRF